MDGTRAGEGWQVAPPLNSKAPSYFPFQLLERPCLEGHPPAPCSGEALELGLLLLLQQGWPCPAGVHLARGRTLSAATSMGKLGLQCIHTHISQHGLCQADSRSVDADRQQEAIICREHGTVRSLPAPGTQTWCKSPAPPSPSLAAPTTLLPVRPF